MTETERATVPHVVLVIRAIGRKSGGAERVYCDLANLLVEEGFRVTCVSFEKTATEPFYPLDPRIRQVAIGDRHQSIRRLAMKLVYKLLPKGLRFRDRVRWNARNRHLVDSLSEFFRTSRPDIAISFLPPANTVTLMATSPNGPKVIATNHSVPDRDYSSDRWGGGAFERHMRLHLLDRASAIHVLFPRYKAWFPRHLHDRIVDIPNCIPTEFFVGSPPQSARDKAVIAVGRLNNVKNYGVLIDAWHLLSDRRSDWKLRLFGVGPEEKALKRQVRDLGLNESVLFCGETDAIGDQYRRASIMCHPALFEGFGLSVVEALACGTPVVAFRATDGLGEYLEDGKNAVLVSREGYDVQNLADGLAHLMNDAALRELMGHAGQQTAARFSAERYRDRWLDLIADVLNHRDKTKV